VKVAVVSRQVKEAVVALLGVDEFFGEGLFDRATQAPGGGCYDE
jgi:hypothetical protein